MLRKLCLAVSILTLSCGAQGSPPGPAIHFLVSDAEVTRTLLPEQVHVRVTGLPPASRVTLRASMPGYASHASFHADASGAVEVAAQAPIQGTYEGADADGLFWSMLATSGPVSPIAALDVTFTAEIAGHAVANATLERRAGAEGLVETEVRENGLRAVLVAPAAPGPHPGLITFGGSEGGIETGLQYARLYASLGYTCLGIAYFGEGDLPPYLEEIPLEYFARAIAWMKQRPEVEPEAIGVLGASRGGELALLLGATFAEVKAVVAMVPSGVLWSGWDPRRPEREVSSWTLGGRELACVPEGDTPPLFTEDAQGRTIEYDTPSYNATLDAASPAVLAAATIHVEKVHGPVLMMGSGDDQVWPSCRLARIAMDRLTATGHAARFADDLVCHPGAGHHLGPPGLPTTDPAVTRLDGHVWLAFGGTPAGTAHAARDAFERKRAFLAAALTKQP